MATIYESKFKKTTYDKALSLITNVWTDAEMTDDDFQKEILVWVEQIEQYKPKNLIADTRKFNYAITVEMQDWNANETFPRIIAAGVEKFAIVESKELVAQMSIQQTMEEEQTGKMQNKYFETIEEALEWVK
jgi:chorismate mutase